ncbi:hypothetical protein LA080_009316 [Diaporthe eres]|nr:hypothetical protein LA080_009316 [Diaporthe eres]
MPSQRKGRKSRRVAKHQKARQARKHREARQARINRKSLPDFEARRIALAKMGFHRFLDLPLELREMVWDEFIPSRLVFHGLRPSDNVALGILHNQRRLPIISQVCREARGFAFRHGSKITLGTWRIRPRRRSRGRKGRRGSIEEAWFDTKRDTLLLYGTQFLGFLNQSPYWLDISDDTVAAIRTSNRLACVDSGLEHIHDESLIHMLGSDWLQKADLAYVVEKHDVVPPLSGLVGSGLFGLSGETRAILVDLDDRKTFDKLGTFLTYTAIPSGGNSPTMSFHDATDFPHHFRTEEEISCVSWFDEKFERCCKNRPKSRLVALAILCPD